MQVTVHRLPNGSISFLHTEGAEPVEAELGDGYHVGEDGGCTASIYVFGPPGTLGMTAMEAMRAGVLRFPAFERPEGR